MNLVENMRMVLQLVGFLIVVVLTTPVWAVTELYLDPNVSGGTHVGTQTNPFNALNASAWTMINNALASDNVTLYCSARNASADTNQVWGAQTDLTQKTPNPAFTLTFDGRSKWNANDTTPSWSAYSGSARCQVQSFGSSNAAHVKYSKVTIDGFVIQQPGGFAIAMCGDNWTIKNSDISHTAAATDSPLFLIIPSADAAHEGSSEWCPAMSNIVIQDNVIHDSRGELIYLGGAGCLLSASAADGNALRTNNGACGGMPSHSNITIQGNTISNCGSRGPQGDCIDIKAGITNLTISQNDITGNRNDNDSRCIVMQGITTDGTNQNVVIERNKIHDCLGVDEAAIAIVQFWGTPNGIVVRNNIIANVTSGHGIRVYDTQAAGVQIYNNTFYNSSGFAIEVLAGTVTVRNNALLNNNGGGAQTSMSGTITSDHNVFSGTWGGTCTTCVSGLTSAAFTNVGTQNFILPSNSVLIDKGTTIGSFSNDYLNTLRPQSSAWDIGAYEFITATAQTPSPPQGLRLNIP